MSFWNRLQKTFRTQNPLTAEFVAGELVQIAALAGVIWGLQKSGVLPSGDEKTFKQLHQPRDLSSRKSKETPPEGFQ